MCIYIYARQLGSGNNAARGVTSSADYPLMRAKLLVLWCSIATVLCEDTGTCSASAAANPVVAENCLPGSPSTEWDINGAGDPSIQGFATEISVNAGETVGFKVKTNATNYRVDIWRMGYYGGMGARRHATIRPTAPLPQIQPECMYERATHLVDCGNWGLSATWVVPAGTASGLFFARLVREDEEGPLKNWRVDNSQLDWDLRFSRPKHAQDPRLPPPLGTHPAGRRAAEAWRRGRRANELKDARASHIFFVVRQDQRVSQLLVQTMDTTWQVGGMVAGGGWFGGMGAWGGWRDGTTGHRGCCGASVPPTGCLPGCEKSQLASGSVGAGVQLPAAGGAGGTGGGGRRPTRK
jgi:hypothetical protein